MMKNNLLPLGFAGLLAGLFLPHGVGTILLCIFLIICLKEGGWIPDFKAFISERFFIIQAALWFLYLLSVGWSADYRKAFEESFSKLPLLLVPLALAGKGDSFNRISGKLMAFLTASALLINLICILHVLLVEDWKNYLEALVYESLASVSGVQPIYLSYLSIFAAIAWFFSAERNSFQPKFSFLVPAFLYLMVILFSSRTELAVFVILMIITIWKSTPKHLLFKYGSFAGLFLILVSSLLIAGNETNRLRFSEAIDFSTSYHEKTFGGTQLRMEKWKNSILSWKKNPLLGSGAGDYKTDLLTVYRENNFEQGLKESYNSHNQYLQILATLGPLGLALFLAVFFFMYKEYRRSRQSTVLLCAIAVSLSMITESMLERRFGLFLSITLVNIFFIMSRSSEQHAQTQATTI